MKKHFAMLAAAALMAAGASAQNVSTLNWDRNITQDQLNAAYSAMESSGLLGTSISAQYALRGGKENGAPESHCYQYEYSLNVDNYAGYFVVTHYDFPYANAILTSTYAMHEAFNGGARGQYTMVKNILIPLLQKSAMNDMPELKAVNLLYYCLAAQEVADISGPFTYLEDKQGSENPKTYNDLKTIYHGIVADLDNIVACLKNYPSRPAWYKDKLNGQFDTYQTGRPGVKGEEFVEACWRMANSLKLRMAMHIVKVEPEVAKQWAEDAVESGVIEEVAQQACICPATAGCTHPLVEICNAWNDNRLNANFEMIMMSLDHPYAKVLFRKNSSPITNRKTGVKTNMDSRIVGIRPGAKVGEGQSASTNPYIAASTFDVENGEDDNELPMMNNAPLYLVKLAEVNFLRAEGRLRGWKMSSKKKEDAEYFYDEGIKHAGFDEPDDRNFYKLLGKKCYDDFLKTYTDLEEAKPYTQVDAFGDGNDYVSPIKIGVMWDDDEADEVKLEKIITQKWLALFPLSSEAWTELRRTGYPRMMPTLNPQDGDGSLKYGEMIRRMPWAATDEQDKANIAATGLAALGGPDRQATRLWWDVATIDNFGNTVELGVEARKATSLNIFSGNGNVIVSGLADGEEVSVYALTGALVAKAKAVNGSAVVSARGEKLVVVNAGSESKKLVVE